MAGRTQSPVLPACTIFTFVSGASNAERFGQLDIYLPIAAGFQILALPNFVHLADIFLYAHSKGEYPLSVWTYVLPSASKFSASRCRVLVVAAEKYLG